MAVNYKNKWVRFDNKLIFKKSKDLSDNIMHEYGAVVSVNRKFLCFIMVIIMEKRVSV